MGNSKKGSASVGVRIVKAMEAPERPIQKAETATSLDTAEAHSAGEFVTPPYPLIGLANLVRNSNILPQCLRSYKGNIAGFGIGIRYKEDVGDETPEMKAEWARAEEIIDLLNMDKDTKAVFEDVVEGRERFGISYLEVIRDATGDVVGIDYIRDIPSVQKTYPLEPPVDATYIYKGKEVRRPRKFCKYKQEVGGQTVYFKEFGDPRVMDNRSGRYQADPIDSPEAEALPTEHIANEILEFAIGTEIYGEVRWMGQILGVDGSRKAEDLNNNYFENGRHTPLLIAIKGGTLSEESFSKLEEYMNGIKGKAGQHAFLILEAEGVDNKAGFEADAKPEIEVKDLAAVLQKDELFQEYIDNNRKRVQSAFQLPDLYVGYTTDFNRATAQTAMEVTEEQVFQPERKSLAWIINNKLLNGYGFKYVEAYFKEPDISNPDDLYKILTVAERAGGLPPNKAKAIVFEALGDTAEDYEGEWGNVPIAAKDLISSMEPAPQPQPPGPQFPSATPDLLEQLTGQIQKAAASRDDEVVAVMKQVRRILLEMQEGETDGM